MTSESRARLRRLVARFARVRVLVVGDLLLDRFIWGGVRRISPEAPVPVVHVRDEDACPGGAGNVVSNVAALGGRVAVCGVVGQDDAGRRLTTLLGERGARVDGVVRSRATQTIQKTRIIANHQQVVRLDRERPGPLDARTAGRLRRWVLAHLRRTDVLVVSDYGKGVIDAALLAALAAAHAERPFTWLIDPKQANFEHYRGATLVKPNVDEAAAAAGIAITGRGALAQAGRHLLRRWEAEAVLISQGEEGLTLFRRGGRTRSFPTVAHEVFDVTGAGDTVIATCALALGAGGSAEDATMLANQAAGLAVAKVGTAPVGRAELRRALGTA
jgi:D-beta-D-heptose 7-phosphate kinase/D-beta-D-heptose 1-phosphate adenosyltransferase